MQALLLRLCLTGACLLPRMDRWLQQHGAQAAHLLYFEQPLLHWFQTCCFCQAADSCLIMRNQ